MWVLFWLLMTPNGAYIKSTEDIPELLVEEHFPDFIEQESVVHTCIERTRTSWPDGVYPIFLQKGIDIILGTIIKRQRTSLALVTYLIKYGANPELVSFQNSAEMDISTLGTSYPSILHLSS